MRASTNPGMPTSERYRLFAEVEARGMSACYESWASGVADDPATAGLIDRLPGPKRQPNLVFSAARFHGAVAGDYPAFARWLAGHWPEVEATCLTHATQTNEPGRCASLLPALAALDGPLALIEVGASAGLCLYPDRYSYRYHSGNGTREVHPAGGPGSVVFDCDTSGPVPVPDALPDVVWRAGVDLSPLDVNSEQDVAWLEALIWPEHTDRRERLRAAVEVARSEPVELVKGDLNDEVASLVARAPAGATVVVFHTAVLLYLDDAERDRFAETMAALPAHWLANEGQIVLPGVLEEAERSGQQPTSTSDFIVSFDGRPLAFTQPHGRALHWLG